MSQDKESGAKASQWGHETAKKIAHAIGATIPGASSNECSYEGNNVVIKCAALNTDSVGVTYSMMGRISHIIGAFQTEDSSFDVWTLPIAAAQESMRPTASRGTAAGKVGIIRKELFLKRGRNIQRVRLGDI